jgi:hypothetical protein
MNTCILIDYVISDPQSYAIFAYTGSTTNNQAKRIHLKQQMTIPQNIIIIIPTRKVKNKPELANIAPNKQQPEMWFITPSANPQQYHSHRGRILPQR